MHFILWQSFYPLVLLWFIFRKYDFFFFKFRIKYLCIFLCKPMRLCCLLTILFHGWTANEHKLKLHLQKCFFFPSQNHFAWNMCAYWILLSFNFPKEYFSLNHFQCLSNYLDENGLKHSASGRISDTNPLPLCFSRKVRFFLSGHVGKSFFYLWSLTVSIVLRTLSLFNEKTYA